MSKALRHFLDLGELPTKELRNMLALSVAMRAKLKAHAEPVKPLEGKTLAMIFEKPSTRTRVSFDVGMRQLGGEAIMLTGAEMQLGRGETIADTARVLSRYVDAIMIRILNHDALLELAPNKSMRDWIKATQAPIVLGNDPETAVRDADCVVTDTWFSMGDKDGEHRHNLLKPYQVNAKLMSLAKPDALFMHCLPAHRGDEVTDEVIDGPQSVVFDEAENRLHAQKGILAWCFEAVA